MSTSQDRLGPEAEAERLAAEVGRSGVDRRRFVALLTALGAGATPVARALAAQEAKAGGEAITRQAVAEAEVLTGLHFSDPQRELMLKGLGDLRDGYRKLRELPMPNDLPPALRFDPAPAGLEAVGSQAGPGGGPQGEGPDRAAFRWSDGAAGAAPASAPANLEDLAFLPVGSLSALVRERRVTSVALTKMYLARLKRFDPLLHAVITLTEERALAEADRADREIASGRYRGPLHGIPWGAKDLLAARGYPTTWGSVPFKQQVIAEDATVVERLGAAGAVLVAKLSLGELAWGDVWFGGMTRNPWNPEQGSSGSSAGSAAATTAGLVGFSLGTETLGSIASPSTRTGATGLRPTFGRVSRSGAMALCWSMDKIGPICRSVEDCAAVFQAIQGPDGRDATVADRPFVWNPALDVRRLRVGYVRSLFEAKPDKDREEWHALDLAVLDALRGLGIEPRPIELPALPIEALSLILTAEAATAFDDLTRTGRSDQLVRQVEQAWPNIFRQGETVPAVSYLQANRLRTLAMREMAKLFADLDAYVTPTYGGNNLLLTNMTGHPAVILPNGFRKDGTPTSITFQGRLYGEATLLALAKAYQDATGFHLRHPTLQPAVARS